MSYKHVNKRNQPDYFIVEGYHEILVLGIIGLIIYFS